MKMQMRFLLAITAAMLVHAAAWADSIAITNARILTMGAAGEISAGTILITDGRLVAIARTVKLPADARTLDARGATVTPGFIMTGTTLGISDLPGYGILDDSATDNAYVSAAYDIRYSLNPANVEIVDARADGVTAALITPELTGGDGQRPRMFGGMAAVVQLGEGADMIVKAPAGITMTVGGSGAGSTGGGRGAEMVLFRAVLAEARKAQVSGGMASPIIEQLKLSPLDLKALAPVVNGKEPVLVRVDRASDIVAMLQVAQEEAIKMILVGAREGWSVAELIARSDVPVILDPEANIPRGLDDRLATNENAARLIAAGVKVSFQGVHARPDFNIRSPRSVVGRLVGATTLSHASALAALTIDAARIAGVSEQMGSLEVGKRADLIVWDGDPLEAMSHPNRVFIGGREQNIKTRADLLGERYLSIYRASGVLPNEAERAAIQENSDGDRK